MSIEFPTIRWPVDCHTEMTVEHFDDIKSFVEKHNTEGDTPTP